MVMTMLPTRCVRCDAPPPYGRLHPGRDPKTGLAICAACLRNATEKKA